jgi:GTPase Era involved in 16S rRNA processing
MYILRNRIFNQTKPKVTNYGFGNMSNSVYKVFEEIEFKAKLLAQYWDNFHTEISQHLPESYQPEIQELSNNLETALTQLIYELQNPTLTLATTGTTSSGKSTLVNLLCGAEIVPVAVSEMSAGAVTIEYSKEKSLIIHETPGALWECGEWRGISEERIYQLLYQAMKSHIKNKETQPNLACPQSTITYPFRLLEESQLQLPKGTKVSILDLPGLAHVGDQGNANVIKQCREALCIVTYNSAETDKQKVKSLLQEVVQQVKHLGGSPARMLFVLNRIDEFRKDRNWPESENDFVENTVRSIKNELTERLKEYTEEIEKLEVVRLSTWPALLSLQIQNQDDIYSADACKKARNHFYGLIEDILEDLPVVNTQKWTRHDKNRVAQALWQKSYGEEFQQNLREHINKHFPQLVIPQMIDRFNIAAGDAIKEWALQTTTAILNSSQKYYQQECKNIEQSRLALEHLLEFSTTKLREPFERLDIEIQQAFTGQSKKQPGFYLEKTLKELTNVEPYNRLGDKLFPLYAWPRELRQGINSVLEAVAGSLKNGTVDLQNTYLEEVDYRKITSLKSCLERLIKLGYTGSLAQTGEETVAKTDYEKDQLQEKIEGLNKEFNLLANDLSLVMEDVLQKICKQELNRMHNAVEELFKCYLSYFETKANESAPNMGINFPESKLVQVEKQPKINFKFQADFLITDGTVTEKTRSFFRWLWFEEFDETRSTKNAKILSADELLEKWLSQAGDAEGEIVKEIADWLLKENGILKKNVGEIQNDIIDRYQARLNQANKEITVDFERQRNVWQPMQQKAQQMAKEFSILNTLLKEES